MSEEQEQKPEDVKPKLTVNVQFQTQTCTVKVRATTQFKKIFDAAEAKFGQPSGAFRYTFEGSRIRPEQTPGELEMEDGDTIDAHLQQLGGALCL
ncbi:ubiquitin-related domain-containing protein [Phanerochaete sordida]|uniref:Ubiquitin-related domain-containing protein n=1 Tax=Phanerochaete sordida TaxID=48140 RepID=A0A9P3GU35_9APHY|nr:ubiquitin-related domain-containing protein [Phanerochaete sordida]